MKQMQPFSLLIELSRTFWGRSEVVTPASSMLDKKLDFSIAKLVTNELLQVGKSPSAQCLVLIGKLIVIHA
ncbi:hypothetical protein AWQ14_16060 [Vibrio parahaemolyticus]|nr:hypothetical protein [Vibrio parahaemolyticus]EGR3401658.1 hypothetical protein [Vibrio parahaemolyticus]KYY59906.1 hypothetical protein AWQ14_16060 [Vibrio parahaemolyticus]KYY87774.1 hypothetical protein AW029_10775 [Vibrio parahaemolyticus]OKY48253.1 hypothetical protein BUL36_15470 [Vibrio parahaemolyticus]